MRLKARERRETDLRFQSQSKEHLAGVMEGTY